MSSRTPGPWEYIASTEHHGPYVVGPWSGDICDCYTMSDLSDRSVRNGGSSRPIPFQGEDADANARLIAAAPCLLAALTLLLADVADYPAWQRPCHAVDVARAAIARATGGQS